MATKSLKERIDKLVNALGGVLTPKLGSHIRGELVAIGGLVEALENGQSTAEQEARIADLEAQLGDLQAALIASNAEIKRLRDKQKAEDKKWDLPPEQFEILKILPSENTSGCW